MFRGLFDPPSGLAVWLFTRGDNTDEDWQRYCDAVRASPRVLGRHPAPFGLQVIDPDSTDPSAKWRREIAQASELVTNRYSIALVSQSMVVRGVVTAVTWLRPPAYALHVVASEAEACALADKDEPGRGAKARGILRALRAAK